MNDVDKVAIKSVEEAFDKFNDEEGRKEIGDWKSKIWGRTRCLVNNQFYSEHELNLNLGGICSFHYHKNRANLFHVESGTVKIVWAFGWKVESVTLTSGNTYTISSLVPHQFQCIKPANVKEIYFPDRGGVVSNSDIIRLTYGVETDIDLINTTGIVKNDGTYWEIWD